MAMGRTKTALVFDAEQRKQLESLANSHALPAGLMNRAQMVLPGASGTTNVEIAQQQKMTNATVGKWRRHHIGLLNK